jgi:hypothetical protein
MLNWLLKFGWSHPDPTFDKKYPTLSMDQMIELFMVIFLRITVKLIETNFSLRRSGNQSKEEM